MDLKKERIILNVVDYVSADGGPSSQRMYIATVLKVLTTPSMYCMYE